MDFSGDPTGSENTAFEIDEQLRKLTVNSDNSFTFTETQTREVLHVTHNEIVSECFSDALSEQADTVDGANFSTLSTWECVPPESKNLDRVVDVLSPEEVRWFYKSETEKRWLEFSGYDSLRIEYKYQDVFHKWHSAHYPEDKENETEESNDTGCALFSENDSFKHDDSSNSFGKADSSFTTDSEHKIVVRGGLYEVDLHAWKCNSIYWPGEECAITRGTWFYATWQPLEADHCDQLEAVHLSLFIGKKLLDLLPDPTCNTARPALHTEPFAEFQVDWYSPSEVYLYSEAAPSKLMRSVTQRLGFQKSTGYRLYRGYKSLATESDRPSDISHLVFVIHGIGQKMDTGRIIRNTSTFRGCVDWIKEKYFNNTKCRAEFFPVEWRSSLKLDGDIVDSITPHKLVGLRQMLNSSAMDIMYYTSPLYGNEVQQGLTQELNRLYSMFSQRNPYFEKNGGKVSVMAHSLGCVIVYDIVTGWKISANGPTELPENGCGKSALLFQIDNLFCLGSPLSVFLALRFREPEDHVLPPSLCRRLYNIFHPSDPVAYRMEPLLVREYSKVAPLQIHAYSSAATMPSYDDLLPEPLVPDGAITTVPLAPTTAGSVQPTSGASCDTVSASTDNSVIGGWSLWGLMRSSWQPRDGPGSPIPDATKGHIKLPHRLDYLLRETNLGGSYLSALTSHTAYWSNYDVAYFVLTRLFPHLEEEDADLDPDRIPTSYLAEET
ncbi:phospholipase DDHD1-like isoform X1 [Schistocerca serialis cubense]|uniref:phospholipase DDHD1-like isoform X1 n=1 Tax=Schistocerca serialis cubense TaxID=2023355 RepID=UPI00214E0043|nr:phospholipase DDHD1-like isoform X1 [Schistocerca serialis cubense]